MSREQNTEGFLVNESARLKAQVQRVWVVGAVLIIFVGGYLTWIRSAITNDFLNPKDLSVVIADRLDESIPVYLSDLKVNLSHRAPEIAETGISYLESSVHQAGNEFRRKIDEVHSSIPLLGDEIAQTIKAFVVENEDEIKAFARAHSEQEFAEHFSKALIDEVMKQVDLQLKMNSGGDGLREYRVDTLSALKELDLMLKDMLSKNAYQMTEGERLKRRLVVGLYRLFTDVVTNNTK